MSVKVTDPTSETVADLDAPPSDPVIVAAWSVLKFDALIVNVPLLAFAGIATDEGTTRLGVLELRVTLVAAGAGPDRDAVQTPDPLGARVPGLQAIPVRVSVGVDPESVMVPSALVSGTELPVAEAPRTLPTETTAELAPDASVTETSATTPLGMAAVLGPVARQV